jgi:hypothetical protein
MSGYGTSANTTGHSIAQSILSPYSKFKMALKSKEVQGQNPNFK